MGQAIDWGPFPRLAARATDPWGVLAAGSDVWPAGWGRVHPAAGQGALLPGLVECHAWLGAELARVLTPAFEPLWREIPAGLTATSGRSVAWTLAAYRRNRWGLVGWFYRWCGLPRQCVLGPDSLPGDLLILHRHIESIVRKHYRGTLLGIDGPLPGGLRTLEFLTTYPILSAAARRNVDVLIQHSPLTRLIYADLTAGLTSETDVPELGALLGQGRGAWREFWLAQLARSLLAALLSPSPYLIEWRRLEAERLRLESAIRHARGFERARLQQQLTSVTENGRRAAAMVGRVLADRYQTASAVTRWEDKAPHCRWLRILLLDMLARHAVTCDMRRLVREWAQVSGREGLPRIGHLLSASESRAATVFHERLLGMPVAVLVAEIGTEQGVRLREGMDHVLNPPPVPSSEDFADATGIPNRATERLLCRFYDDAIGGVPLPFAPLNDRGPAPGTLLSNWLAPLLNALPQRPPGQSKVHLDRTQLRWWNGPLMRLRSIIRRIRA